MDKCYRSVCEGEIFQGVYAAVGRSESVFDLADNRTQRYGGLGGSDVRYAVSKIQRRGCRHNTSLTCIYERRPERNGIAILESDVGNGVGKGMPS